MVEFIFKSIRFLKNYLFHDPVFVMYYMLAYFQNTYSTGAQFFTRDEICNQIKSGKSFIRMGDGEFSLIHGRAIHYQKYEKKLGYDLRLILKNYNQNSKYILAIPIFAKYSNKRLKEVKDRLRCWLPLKVEFKRMCNKSMVYGDAHLFYYKDLFQNQLETYFRSKKLIIHTEKRNIESQRKNIEQRFNVLGWVEALPGNSYSYFEKDKQKIESLIADHDPRDIIYLGAAGPVSKSIAFYMSQKIQCIDIGKGFEQLYNNVNFEHEIQVN